MKTLGHYAQEKEVATDSCYAEIHNIFRGCFYILLFETIIFNRRVRSTIKLSIALQELRLSSYHPRLYDARR